MNVVLNNTGDMKIGGGDQIEVFMTLNGHENIDPNIFKTC